MLTFSTSTLPMQTRLNIIDSAVKAERDLYTHLGIDATSALPIYNPITQEMGFVYLNTQTESLSWHDLEKPNGYFWSDGRIRANRPQRVTASDLAISALNFHELWARWKEHGIV